MTTPQPPWPRQMNPTSTDRIARAPYNFVPLPDQVVAAETVPDQDTYYAAATHHTGHITCTLTTEVPLYVRGALNPEDFAAFGEKPFDQMTDSQREQYAQFFQVQQTPVIPGSSLRGMLRTLIEIISHGKIERVTDQPRYFFRAVAAPSDDPLAQPYRETLKNVQAGYLFQENGDWFICPAQKLNNATFLKVRERDISSSVGLIHLDSPDYRLQEIAVSFITKQVTNKKTSKQRMVVDAVSDVGVHPHEGKLVTSGNMRETGSNDSSTRSHHYIVPTPDTTAKPLRIDNTAIADYCRGLTDFQKEQLDEQWGVLQPGRSVFYCAPQKGEAVQFFGHSPNFRLPYRFTDVHGKLHPRAASPADFVPAALKDSDQIDIAEALFGYVRGTKQQQNQAYAGRVTVSDAHLSAAPNGIWWCEEAITPHILSSPKPTTFQHYLVQTSTERAKLKHYASTPGTETVIRGHKLYWHQGAQPDIVMSPDEQQGTAMTQQTRIRPVKAGVSFTFTIHFENVTNVELGALLWVLQIAGDRHYRLKLGMGKPLGMGAVKISHNPVLVSDRYIRYTQLFDGDGWATGEQPFAPEEETACIQKFTAFVRERCGAGDPDQPLERLPRIQMLLWLLRWPGPEPAAKHTRYMEIQHKQHQTDDTTTNEYKDRPVLPTPQQLWIAARGTAPELERKQTQKRRVPASTDTRIRGVVEKTPTATEPGMIGSAEKKGGIHYRYSLTDVVGNPPAAQAAVVFKKGSRVMPGTGSDKKVPWAEHVEQVMEES